MLSAIFRENRKTLVLAAPMIAGQVGQMLMAWADSLMVGRVSVAALAACAFGNMLLATAIVFGFGVMTSVTVRASQAFGANGDTDSVFRASLLLGGALGVILCILEIAVIPILPMLGQPLEVNHTVVPYLVLVSISIVPLMLFTATKNFSEALSRPWLPFWIVLGGVLLNVALNFPLIFGMWGLPALGLTGAGLATLVARIVDFVVLLALVGGAGCRRPRGITPFSPSSLLRNLRHLLRVGAPAGGQHLAEISSVAISTVMMGWLGMDALAAHQIALTCATTTLMVPLGIGMAVTVRVGQALGAGELDRVRPVVFGGLSMAVAAMSCFGVCFVVFARPLAALFVTDPNVLAVAVSLLGVAALFQIVDGLQVVAINALRGLGDVRVPLLLVIGSFWVVALPSSYALAFHTALQATGIWVGLALGLLTAGIALTSRFLWKSSPLRLTTAYRAPHA